ncbi:hypothetical protein KBD13_00820 [Patescibacteria group bacterium]|nr:hypothetical protein [Patescibacteria group bacterium]
MLQLLLDPVSAPVVAPSSTASLSAIGVLVVLGIALFLGILAMRGFSRSSTSNWEVLHKEKIRQQWEELSALLKLGAPGRKLAIIEADKLLDRVLRGVGFPGETFAERLKVAEYKHKVLREMWEPHKLRNRLVHEESFTVSERQAEQALALYKRALQSLRLL